MFQSLVPMFSGKIQLWNKNCLTFPLICGFKHHYGETTASKGQIVSFIFKFYYFSFDIYGLEVGYIAFYTFGCQFLYKSYSFVFDVCRYITNKEWRTEWGGKESGKNTCTWYLNTASQHYVSITVAFCYDMLIVWVGLVASVYSSCGYV